MIINNNYCIPEKTKRTSFNFENAMNISKGNSGKVDGTANMIDVISSLFWAEILNVSFSSNVIDCPMKHVFFGIEKLT